MTKDDIAEARRLAADGRLAVDAETPMVAAGLVVHLARTVDQLCDAVSDLLAERNRNLDEWLQTKDPISKARSLAHDMWNATIREEEDSLDISLAAGTIEGLCNEVDRLQEKIYDMQLAFKMVQDDVGAQAERFK